MAHQLRQLRLPLLLLPAAAAVLYRRLAGQSGPAYEVKPFPLSRRLVVDTGRLGARRHRMFGLIEVDVTEARRRIRRHREQSGDSLSFTAYRAETPTKQMMAHVLNPVPSLPAEREDLPPALDAVVSTALAKDPGERYQTAGELALEAAAALGGAAATPRPAPQGPPIHEPPPATIPTAPAASPRRRLAAGAFVLLLAVLGGVWAVAGRDRGGQGAIATGDATLAVAAATTTSGTATPTPSASAIDAPGVVALATRTPTRTGTPTPTSTVTTTKAPPLAAGAQPLSAAASPTPRPRVQAVVPSAAVRRGPGPNYPAFAYLVQNEVADVLSRTAGIIWFLVRLADGSEGWVHTGGVILLDNWSVGAVATAATTPTPPLPPTPSPLPPTPTFTPPPTFTVTPSLTPTPCCITPAPPTLVPTVTLAPPLPTATP